MSEPSTSLANKPKFWNDPATRALIFQLLAAVGVIAFFYYIISNALTNMEARGITTGFDFLSKPAGFGILQTLIDFDETYSYGRTFFVGLLNTLLVSVLGIILASMLGLTIGIARLSHNWLVARLATVYIETFRNIPLLLQIFFWYFAVLRALPAARDSITLGESFFLNNRGLYIPKAITGDGFGLVWIAVIVAIGISLFLKRYRDRMQAQTGKSLTIWWPILLLIIGLPLLSFWIVGSPLTWEYPELKRFNFQGGMTVYPELIALLVALTIYTAAFIAEVVRSGIQAVSKGQNEAANALGLTRGQTLRLIIVPQALRVIIPPLTNQYLNLIKNSSLATAIGYPDLVSVFAGTTLNQTGQAVEIIFMTMAVYLTFSLITSGLMNWYNKRIALVER